jgi:hypothetical protein
MNKLYANNCCVGVNCASKSKNCVRNNYISFRGIPDTFIKNTANISENVGLEKIENVMSGMYSAVCDGSKPLGDFTKKISNYYGKDKIMSRGLSTNTMGISHSFLKTNAQNPISTSNVHDCSVMYLYNEKTDTHFLYHSGPNTSRKVLNYMINNFMPEGVTHAGIVSGDNAWTMVHRSSLEQIFSSIKQTNPDAVVNVYHQNSRYPEIVGYKGELFEIPNKNIEYGEFGSYGQASFPISDIQGENTLDVIRKHSDSNESLQHVNDDFQKSNYDKEMKNVLDKIINRKYKK